jgi:hypothetical protein
MFRINGASSYSDKTLPHIDSCWKPRLIRVAMPPKGASTKVAAIRLPPLPKLRVRRPNQTDANPCLGIMTSVLSTLPHMSSAHYLSFILLTIIQRAGLRPDTMLLDVQL